MGGGGPLRMWGGIGALSAGCLLVWLMEGGELYCEIVYFCSRVILYLYFKRFSDNCIYILGRGQVGQALGREGGCVVSFFRRQDELEAAV